MNFVMEKALADSNSSAVPDILRKGLQKNVDKYSGPWFDGVGPDTPKALEHSCGNRNKCVKYQLTINCRKIIMIL
jgi:hypothetical protein